MVSVSLIVNVRLRMRHIVNVRLRVQMWLMGGSEAAVNRASPVPIDHSPLLRKSLTLDGDCPSLDHLSLDHWASNTIRLPIRLTENLLISVRHCLIELPRRMRNLVNVRCRMRHCIDMIPVLNLISMRCRMGHAIKMGGRVGDVVEMRGRVRNAINVRGCVRHCVDMVAVADVVRVGRRVRHIVKMRGRVWHDMLRPSGGHQRHGCNGT